MFKKLFKFGKKKQEELNENEVINEQESTIEENSDNTNDSKQDDILHLDKEIIE